MVGWLVNDESEKDVEGSSHSLTEEPFQHSPQGTEENHEKSH
jgi:hypothetical protein